MPMIPSGLSNLESLKRDISLERDGSGGRLYVPTELPLCKDIYLFYGLLLMFPSPSISLRKSPTAHSTSRVDVGKIVFSNKGVGQWLVSPRLVGLVESTILDDFARRKSNKLAAL
jgi:hypothetical protein